LQGRALGGKPYQANPSLLGLPVNRESRILNFFSDPRSSYAALTIILLATLVVEWLWFESSVRELVLPTYPRHHDQTRYLTEAYLDHFAIRDRGMWQAFAQRVAAGSPSGALFDFEAALAFRLVEANRLGALAVIFAHFAALQMAFFHVASWATRSPAFGLVAVALLASSGFLFVVPGGWFDFRIDAAASCAFGVFVAALVRSDFYRDRLWSVLAGIAGGYLIALRHNMVAHLAFIHVTFLAALLLAARNDRDRRRGFACSAAAIAAVAGPFLFFGGSQVAAYYSSQLAARGPVRNALAGRSALQHWLFYPYNVVIQHSRLMPLVWVAALSLPWAMRRRSDGMARPRLGPWSRYAPPVAAIVVPLAILTAHSDRSTTVAGLALPPLALLATFALADLAARRPIARPAGTAPPMALACAVLAAALALHAAQHRLWRRAERARFADHVAVFEMHHAIAKAAAARGLVAADFVTNTLEDSFQPGIASTALFEREQRLLVPRLPLLREQIFAVGEEELWRVVRSADVALLQTRGPRVAFPFVAMVGATEDRLRREIDGRYDKIGDWSFADSAASAYVAPSP
jgi:hypothetical protein